LSRSRVIQRASRSIFGNDTDGRAYAAHISDIGNAQHPIGSEITGQKLAKGRSMVALVIRAIDQQAANPHFAHFAESDFLARGPAF